MPYRFFPGAIVVAALIALPLAVQAQTKPAVTITESGGKTQVAEGGATDSYTVVLTTLPTANVTITLGVPTAQVQASSASLTFTPANWNVAQTVTVTAVDDTLVEGLHLASITHAATSSDTGYNGVPIPDVVVSISDNDQAKVNIAESGGKTEVAEGGSTDTYTVVLSSQPSANVTVTLGVPTAQIGAAPGSLTFTPANWSATQTVTVSAVDDTVDEGLHQATITHTAASTDGNYNGIPVGDVVVTIIDNDKANVRITESGGKTEVAEGGFTDSYTVVLDTPPQASVTISVGGLGTQLQANPTNLTFTTTNWNVAQTVNIAAINDSIAEGLHFGTITHAISTSDPNYSGLSISDLLVAISDNDVPKVRINESAGKTDITEGEKGDTFTVVLDTQPASNVVCTISGMTPQMVVHPTTLQFSPSSWNVGQTVQVLAKHDGTNQGIHYASLTNTITSGDPNYNGLAALTINVTINDNTNTVGKLLSLGFGEHLKLRFPTQTNLLYTIEQSGSLNSSNWQILTPNIPGNGSQVEISDLVTSSNRFYRLKITGNNPANTNKLLFTPPARSFGLSFLTLSNQTYRLEYNTNLASTNWLVLKSNILGSGFRFQMSDPVKPGGCFYRLRVLP